VFWSFLVDKRDADGFVSAENWFFDDRENGDRAWRGVAWSGEAEECVIQHWCVSASRWNAERSCPAWPQLAVTGPDSLRLASTGPACPCLP